MADTKDYRVSHIEDRIVKQYEEVVYKEGSYDDFQWQYEKKILLRELDVFKKNREYVTYLDFGCGTGRIIGFLEDQVAISVGVDISESMIEVARSKLKKSKLIVADITRNDVLAGQQFDLITAFRELLNAQPELRHAMMRVFAEKLKDSEAVVIFNMHGNLWSHRLFTKLLFSLQGRKLNTSSYGQAKRLAELHGLHIVRWYGFGVLPKIFYRFLGGRVMYHIDLFLTHILLLKFVSYNLIFVCKRK